MSPQILHKKYNHATDIWSCGCILYTMLSGRPPFFAVDKFEIMKKVCTGKYDFDQPVWSNVCGRTKSLIKGMLCYDDTKRLTAHDCLFHDIFVNPHGDGGSHLLSSNTFFGERSLISRQDNLKKGKLLKSAKYDLSKHEIQNALANMKTFKVKQKLK